MRTNRIEIAQKHDRPIRVRLRHIGQDALVHVLCPAVGIGAARGHGFIQRHMIRNAVHRSRRAENEPLHAMLLHRFAYRQCAIQIVAVVFQRLGDGFAHRLIGRKVNHRVHLVFRENPIHRIVIAGVRAIELHALAGQLFHALNRLGAAVVQIIHDDDVVPRVQQLNCRVRTDETGAAGQKNVHGIILLPFLWLVLL